MAVDPTGSSGNKGGSPAVAGPTVTITLDDTQLKIGDSATVTFAFSEAVTGFGAEDIVRTDAKGTLHGLAAVGTDGKTWKARFTPMAGIEVAKNTISVDLAGVTDAAGHPGVGSASSANYQIDTKRPVVDVYMRDINILAGNTTSVIFYFNEAVTGFGREDMDLTNANGTLGDLTTDADGKTWYATFTPTANIADTTNTIRVDLSHITDLAGNAGQGLAESNNYMLNIKAPVPHHAMLRGKKLSVNFHSENDESIALDPVHKPASGDFKVLIDGVADTVTAVDVDGSGLILTLTTANVHFGQTMTLTYTDPTPDDDTNAVQDVTGKDAPSFPAFWVDVITGISSYAVNGNQLVTPLGGRTPRDTVPTPPNEAFTVLVDGVADVVTDVTVNTNADPDHDTIALALTNAVTAGQQVTFAYTKPTSGDDINVLRNASTGDILSEIPASPVTNITPVAPSGPDTQAPTLRSSGIRFAARESDITLQAGETAIVTFNFSEAVKGFDIADVSLPPASGTLSDLHATGGGTWSATLTAPTTNSTLADISPTVNLTGLTDLAGNKGVGTQIPTNIHYAVDTEYPAVDPTGSSGNNGANPAVAAPTATITLDDTRLKIGDSATVTFAFSQAVTGFGAKDIVLPDAIGSLSTPTAVVGTNGKTWSAIFTPKADAEDTTNTLRVDLSRITTSTGHTGQGWAESENFVVDTKAPVVSSATVNGDQLLLHYTEGIALDASHTAAREAFTVHLDGAADTVNAVLLQPTDKTVTLTLAHAVTADQQVNVSYTDPTTDDDIDAVQDTTGNDAASFTAMAASNITPDTQAPTLRSSGIRFAAHASDTTLRSGDTATVTFDFSEAVKDFDITDVNLPPASGTLSDLHPADGGTSGATWSATLSAPTTDSTSARNQPTVNLAGLTDLAGNKGVGTQVPTDIDYAVDTGHPVSAPTTPVAPLEPVTPVTPVTPVISDTPDMDSDGLFNTVEDRVPGLPGPNGAAPMAGDGNGDGIEDSEQAAVGSTSVVLSPTGASDPADAPTSFVTLVDNSRDGKPDADPDDKAHITGLEQNDAPTHLPQGLEMPIGLVRMEATLAAGSNETFSLYLDPALGINGDWVQDDSGVWVNLASAPYGGQMVLEGGRLRLDFRITDGGPFDADGQANGAITVPAAPAQMPLSIVGQAPDTGHDGFWF